MRRQGDGGKGGWTANAENHKSFLWSQIKMWVDLLSLPARLWKCVMSFAACLPPPDSQFSGGLVSLHCYLLHYETNGWDWLLKKVMSKQHSFHVTFVALTVWWVRDPFVEIPTSPSECWVCLPFYPFIQTLSTLTKGEVKGKWTPSPWRILLWMKLEGFTVRPAIISREGTWFFLVLEQFYLQHRLHRRLIVPTASR